MIYLDNVSALRLWEASLTGWLMRPEVCPANAPAPRLPSADELASLQDSFGRHLEKPVHVMVGQKPRRTPPNGFVASLVNPSQPLPTGSFYDAGHEVRVPCPELVFARVAQSLELEELLMVGMQLCGTYCVNPSLGETEYGLEPLTSAGKIAGYLKGLSNVRGRKHALQAACHIADGAASPREAALYLTLTLPSKLGGFELPRPVLNDPFFLDGDAQLISGKELALGDLCWQDAGLVVEYDSDLMHAHRRKQDIERRDGLESMGVHVITITTDQFDDFDRFSAQARAIRQALGLRAHDPGPGIWEKRRALHRKLRNYRPL